MPGTTRLIIAGDFNLPDILWDELQTDSTDLNHCDVLLDMVFSKDLKQVVNEATRIGATANLFLDVVFKDSKVTDYVVFVNDRRSDHKLVQVCIRNVLPAKSPRTSVHVRNFATADHVSPLDYL